ncbi:Os04g0372100 [Oryza sativa Japonica Group]|uniref:Os04g0372100 protein n=1 Tax=Oryza sativa subsp. japonica TaxID=39947 RepID=A0A0P0W929_ORYSJ|nr:Os04g0372100 [Oryza sativa Japonica Group]
MMKVEGNVGFTLYERGQIETATNNFNKAHIVGEGGQGTVYRAEIDGTIVAIKRCKEIDESRKMDFVQELVILCRVNHPNIVKLLGCCLQFEAPMLVYEFVQNRTLHELLDFQRNRSCHVTLGTRLRIAAESADALAHLHSLPHPILHGDVKPANILLTEELVAKVSDFGCSTIDEKTQVAPKGTPGYLDPDYLLEYQLTAKNDLYSFGVILVELLTGKRPLSKERKTLTSMFKEAMTDGTLIKLLDSDIVNEDNLRVIHQAAVLASQCLIIPGTARPEMRYVAEQLQQLAFADEVQQDPQPPLVLAGLRFTAEMANTQQGNQIWPPLNSWRPYLTTPGLIAARSDDLTSTLDHTRTKISARAAVEEVRAKRFPQRPQRGGGGGLHRRTRDPNDGGDMEAGE